MSSPEVACGFRYDWNHRALYSSDWYQISSGGITNVPFVIHFLQGMVKYKIQWRVASITLLGDLRVRILYSHHLTEDKLPPICIIFRFSVEAKSLLMQAQGVVNEVIGFCMKKAWPLDVFFVDCEVPHGILESWQSDSQKPLARRNRAKTKRPEKTRPHLHVKYIFDLDVFIQ